MEYESVAQEVLLTVEPIPQNAKQLQHECLSWHTIKHTKHSSLHYLCQFLERREFIFIPIFGSYDN
jgi:hypothetical protein